MAAGVIRFELRIGYVEVLFSGPFDDRSVENIHRAFATFDRDSGASLGPTEYIVVNFRDATVIAPPPFGELVGHIVAARLRGQRAIILEAPILVRQYVTDAHLGRLVAFAADEDEAVQLMVRGLARRYTPEFFRFLVDRQYLTPDQLRMLVATHRSHGGKVSIEALLLDSKVFSWRTLLAVHTRFREAQGVTAENHGTPGPSSGPSEGMETPREGTTREVGVMGLSRPATASAPGDVPRPRPAVIAARDKLPAAPSNQGPVRPGQVPPSTEKKDIAAGGGTPTGRAPTKVSPPAAAAAETPEDRDRMVPTASETHPGPEDGTAAAAFRAAEEALELLLAGANADVDAARTPAPAGSPGPAKSAAPSDAAAGGPPSEFVQKRLLGEILVELSVISEAQLRAALDQQKKDGGRTKLGDILERMGLVTDEQIFRAVEQQYLRRGRTVPSGASAILDRSEFVTRKLLGDILLELGLISEEDLKKALMAQRTSTTNEKLGSILLRLNLVTRDQILRALDTQTQRRGPARGR